VTGTGFTGAIAVRFGSTSAASLTVNSDTSITATSPPGTGTVDVTVTTPGGTSTTGAAEFSYVPAPTVTAVSPNEGPAGTTVTITGTNLTGATAVRFGASSASSYTVESATSITAVAPAGTGTVDVTVTTPGGTSAMSSADQFGYPVAPTVTKVKPIRGPVAGGTAVTIEGTNLFSATAVHFGSIEAASFLVISPTKIAAVSPPEPAGKVDVTVTTPDGTTAITKADKFAFAPTITGVSPNAGPAAGGSTVTVTGTGFLPGTSATIFRFGTTKGTGVSCASTTECNVVAPAHGAGTVVVTATVNKVASPRNRPGDQYTYN
jgi:hypothetical protein